MLTKEELNHSYIRYRPEITEEIFKRIIDKVEELGFKQYSNSNDYENFVSNNLALGNPDYTWYVVKPKYMDNSRSEIKVSDILGDGWENVDTGVEKWSVGSYIVPLQNKLLSRPESLTKGKPYKIVKNDCIPYILPDSGGKINFVDDSDAEEKEGIKWFATLSEAEAFSKSLLKPEEPEPLTIDNLIEKEIVIKGEFYSLPGYAIFEAGKNGYIGSGGKDWRPDCDNNWAGPENFVLATPEEKKWVITCRKQNKFIEKSELNKYDDEGNLIEKEQCVITNTQEEWDFCLSKCDQSSLISKQSNNFKEFNKSYPEGIAVCIEFGSWCGINWFKNNGFQVIPFQEFLDLNGYTLFKPGDKIIGKTRYGEVIHSIKQSSCNKLGVPGKYFVPDKVEYNGKIIRLWSKGTYWSCYLEDVSLYKEEEKYKKKYVKYNKTFTEDMFNYMLDWAKKQNFPGRPYTFTDNTFNAFKIKEYFWFNSDHNYCYGVDNNPQNNTEITFKELFPEYTPKKMQLSDLKNPIFNIGDKVRVIAESLKEFNSSWTNGNNVNYKKGYEGLITSVDEIKSSSEEVNTWYFLDNNYNAISCNLLELVEPVKKEFDRNWYVEVNSQEEADLVFDWLESQGEKVDRESERTFSIEYKYIIYFGNLIKKWDISYTYNSSYKQKQLSDILPNYSSKSKIDKNGYYKVNNQEEYCEIMIWLKTIGEPVTTNYFHVIDGWCYIIFNGGRWVLSDTPGLRVKEEYYFKNNKQSSINISPPVHVIHYDLITNEKPKVKIINVPKI